MCVILQKEWNSSCLVIYFFHSSYFHLLFTWMGYAPRVPSIVRGKWGNVAWKGKNWKLGIINCGNKKWRYRLTLQEYLNTGFLNCLFRFQLVPEQHGQLNTLEEIGALKEFKKKYIKVSYIFYQLLSDN